MIDPMLTSASCAALEKAINSSLSLDPTTQSKLATYAGKIIRIACTKPEIVFYMRIDSSISILQYHEDTADAGIEGPSHEWLALIAADDAASALINGKLKMQGDSRLFLELKDIAEQIDLDWEGYIARFIGDVPAHFAGKAADSLVNFGKQARQTLLRTVDDFLHEEARLVPTRIECENFYAQLRDLEMHIDRIEAKTKRYKKQFTDTNAT
jgi:ubiquinone biosynthesis protein UbiJ